ncbi:MAG: hypothetical protein HOD60_04465 [Candidatus Nitrosopelagicus sp.]|nr:hypothetical protein [Candidatus Nitrosopelagicus sp.]
MKYSEIINFQPIDSVVQIKDSNDKAKATEYVQTFVISDKLAEDLSDLVIPQLQFEEPLDNKGLVVIGNYGTGKSHLLSVISSLAEYPGMINNLQNQNIVETCKKIDGKFIVLRLELGAVRQSLRDIICHEIEKFLETKEVSYNFPTTGIANNKTALQDMMISFQQKFPEQGFLLVIDELLDYLNSRQDQELITDLQFLRELGEFCKSSKFRFIAGLQATLFENPVFQHAAETLRKVKDRFEQFTITKDDLDYVISKRLLNKSQEQKDKIEKHLENFISLYPTLENTTKKFVELYPLHPSYTDVLQRVSFVEKRHIFKNVSMEIKKLLDSEINSTNPGMVSFDSYWKIITSDPSLKTDEDIRQVIEASSTLENKILDSMEPAYRDISIRIIHALSVHRLTTGREINIPLGMTPEELRDMLFLHAQLPEPDPEFLRSTIETALDKIKRSTDGSFISENTENQQWYIDVKKNIDYNAKIEKKITSLDDDKKDRYFFEILQNAMETPSVSAVADRKIWQWEMEWEEKKITRKGYLFFGAPNERSTAQPPRDFYLYFAKFFNLSSFTDEKKSDEVFFKFKDIDSQIKEDILFYCASRDLEAVASGSTKQIYSNKSEQRLKNIVMWIKEHGVSNIQVTFQGNEKSLLEIPITKKGSNYSFREIINSIGSFYLKEHFNQKYPNYPVFEKLITNENKDQYVKETLKFITNNVPSKISTSVLSSLELLNSNGDIDTTSSKYANVIKNKLQSKATNEVLNRDEFMIFEQNEYFDSELHLENDWVLVVLCAMVYSGDLVIGYSGKKISAENLTEINSLSFEEELDFKHVQRPSGIPVEELKSLASLFELSPGLFSGTNLDQGVEKLQNKISEKLHSVLNLKEQLSDSLRFWDVEIYDLQEQENLKNTLDEFKEFLDSLQRFDTSAKIKNIQLSKSQISEKQSSYDSIKSLEKVSKTIIKLSSLTNYVSQTTMILPEQSSSVSSEEKSGMISKIKQNPNEETLHEIKSKLEEIKKSFIEEYYNYHKQSRLDSDSQEKLVSIQNSDSLKKLQKLRNISLLDQIKLSNLENELGKLRPCSELEKSELEASPKCIHCNYSASENGIFDSKARLGELESELTEGVENTTNAIIENLQDPTVSESIKVLESDKQKIISDFLDEKQLSSEISDKFVESLNEVLSGLEKSTLNLNEIKESLQKGGTPCKQDELESRFSKFLEEKTRGKSKSKVRFVLD